MRKKVGVALGSGGARGIAHIGVLKVLLENKIPIDYVSGTSMGAVIGSLFASGMTTKEMEKLAIETNWKKIFDITIPTKGLVKGDRIENLLKEKLKDSNFYDLKIPFFVNAYDIKNEENVIFSKGNVARAVRASISIPGVFVPIKNKNRILVDGGVTDPLPTEILGDYADIIICSNVFPFKEIKTIKGEKAIEENKKSKLPNIVESISSSVDAFNCVLSNFDRNYEKIDVLIDVDTQNIGLLNFKEIKKIIQAGEDAAREKIPEINKLIKRNRTIDIIREISEKFGKNIGRF